MRLLMIMNALRRRLPLGLVLLVASLMVAERAFAKLSATPTGEDEPQDYTSSVSGDLEKCLFGDPEDPDDDGIVGGLDDKHQKEAARLRKSGQLTTASRDNLVAYESASGKNLGDSKEAEGFQDEDSCCVVFVTGAGKDIGGSNADKAALVAQEVDHSIEARRWGGKGKGKKGLIAYVKCEYPAGVFGGAAFALGPTIWTPYIETAGHAAGLEAALGDNGSTDAEKKKAAKAQAGGLAAHLGDLCRKLTQAKEDGNVPGKKGDPMWDWYQALLKCAEDGKKALDGYNDEADPDDRRPAPGK